MRETPMTDNRSGKRDPMPSTHDADGPGGRPKGTKASDESKGVRATGGDKGSKKTNDYETSGRDRNADKGSHNPENLGREGMDNEKVSRVSDSEKNTRGTENEKGNREPDTEGTNRERHTEAARDVDNETEAQPGIGKVNRQQRPETGPDARSGKTNRDHDPERPGSDSTDDKKPRKVSKREKGSRKPGTELTKQERETANVSPDQAADKKAQGTDAEGAGRNRDNEKEARADNDKQKKTQLDSEHGTRAEKEKGSRSAERAGRGSHRGGQTAAHNAG